MTDEQEWDFAHQEAETRWTCNNLLTENPNLESSLIHLEMQFLAKDGADPEAAIRALKMFGYSAHMVEDTDELEATVDGVPFSADEIWLHEERATRIAIARGYVPDGWGFWEPEA